MTRVRSKWVTMPVAAGMRSLVLAAFGLTAFAFGDVKTESYIYKEGETTLEGLVAYDDEATGKRPAVLIVHDWNGLDDYEEARAEMLAEMGYVAFAMDIYGKGVRPQNMNESREQATKYYQDALLYRRRLQAGLAAARAHSKIDADKIVVIGYCFGGTGALELARDGAKVRGIASFHGGLSTTLPLEKDAIQSRIVVFHAAQDPSVRPDQVVGFMEEMAAAEADYVMHVYNVDSHPFTNFLSERSYRPSADRRSWQTFTTFLQEVFGPKMD